MKAIIDIFNSGGHFLLIILALGAVCHIIKTIIDIFKKKNKPSTIKRFADNKWLPKQEITEQEYIDNQFKDTTTRMDVLLTEIELLKTMNPKEHIIIHPEWGVELKHSILYDDDARKWAKENGYSYLKSFKEKGELWIKEEKEAKK